MPYECVAATYNFGGGDGQCLLYGSGNDMDGNVHLIPDVAHNHYEKGCITSKQSFWKTDFVLHEIFTNFSPFIICIYWNFSGLSGAVQRISRCSPSSEDFARLCHCVQACIFFHRMYWIVFCRPSTSGQQQNIAWTKGQHM